MESPWDAKFQICYHGLSMGCFWGCSSPIIVMHVMNHRADSKLAPSQWETSLQSNAVSHWLGANLESALNHHSGWYIFAVINLQKSKCASRFVIWKYRDALVDEKRFDGLVQERPNSSALAMELCLSCTKASICVMSTSDCVVCVSLLNWCRLFQTCAWSGVSCRSQPVTLANPHLTTGSAATTQTHSITGQ